MPQWRGVLVHAIFVLAQPIYISFRYFLNPTYFSSTSTSWLILTILTWIYIITQLTIPFLTSPLKNLPVAPDERFPIGHMDFSPPTDKFDGWFKTKPNNGLLALWSPFYTSCQILPTRADTVMQILNTHNYDWEKPNPNKRILSRIVGKGLVTVEGDTHKSMRKVVTSGFTGHQINQLVPLFYAKGLAFTDSLARETQKSADGSLEMMAQMSRVTLDIIGAACIGKDLNTIDKHDDPLARLYEIIMNIATRSPILFFLVNIYVPEWIVKRLKGTVFDTFERASEQLREEIGALLHEKKKMLPDDSVQQKDILAKIIGSGEFSDEFLTDQMLTFLAAGHDTTASALTWTIWFLCLNPLIQDRLRAECNAGLSNKSQPEIGSSDFCAEKLPYLTAVCNETLRLYPTVPVTERYAAKPTTIGTQTIPAGTTAIISPWAMNRDESVWGADAKQFKPERWIEGPNAANGGANTPYALLTFLHGPRSCIGQNFARTEMRCLLAALVMRFRFEIADPDEKIDVSTFITLKPKDGLRVRLHNLKS